MNTPHPPCNQPHPDHFETREVERRVKRAGFYETITETLTAPTVLCTRLAGHTGPHSEYVFSITEPATWEDGGIAMSPTKFES
jgi:hypothetical protein